MDRKNTIVLLALFAIALPATVLAVQSATDIPLYHTVEHSASRIYDFDGTLVKLDTLTGALHDFNGDISARPAGGHWALRVRPVGRLGSGSYEIQRPRGTGTDAVFLVDRGSGATWLLRWEDDRNGSWYSLEER